MGIDKRLLFLLLPLTMIFSSVANEQTKCVTCHASQVEHWQQSDHAHAMAAVSRARVLGNFNNQTLSVSNHTVQFTKKQQQWRVSIDDKTFAVSHVFGHYPLQQYLVDTQGGKKQVLPFAWDSRRAEDGGQRWINLFDDVQNAEDRFHWQQPLQNWNGMCADCHSTGLVRNYDASSDTFDTAWQDVNVGCASCHTLSDSHFSPDQDSLPDSHSSDQTQKPVKPPLAERIWQREGDAKTAHLVQSGKVNMESCYGCHSLRTPLTDGFTPDEHYLDQFKPSWLFPPLYYPDGQIKEEVYVYGSFMQSKMHAAGVTCIDCHQPHTGKLRHKDNQVCTQCHASDVYDVKHHHQHNDNAGSLCVNCHMPETTYMKVDPRRDHSFRIPNLTFSRIMNTPLACDHCHQDKNDTWLANAFPWSDKNRQWDYQYASWMQGQASSPQDFVNLMQSPQLSAIKKASVLAFLPYTELQIAPEKLRVFLGAKEPLLRLAAVEALTRTAATFKRQYLLPLLTDAYKAVRISAAQALLSVALTGEAKQHFSKAFTELLQSAQQQSWRGEGRVNLAAIFAQNGDLSQAIEQLEQAIFIDAYYEVGYINLADIYRLQNNEPKVRQWLQKGLTALPDSGNLHYSLGLQQIRTGQHQQALQSLQTAQQLQPQNYQFIYTLALMYDELGMTKEKQTLLDSLL